MFLGLGFEAPATIMRSMKLHVQNVNLHIDLAAWAKDGVVPGTAEERIRLADQAISEINSAMDRCAGSRRYGISLTAFIEDGDISVA
jgi:hypothetical protein